MIVTVGLDGKAPGAGLKTGVAATSVYVELPTPLFENPGAVAMHLIVSVVVTENGPV